MGPELLSPGPASDAVVATDMDSNVYFAWIAENKIVVRRWDGTKWQPPEVIGEGFAPTVASGDPARIAWTRSPGSDYEVVVASLP